MTSIKMRRVRLQEGARTVKFNRQPTIYPILHLQGNWLREAGFLPGDYVYIFVQDGKIVLKIEPDTETEAKSMQMFEALNDRA